MPEIELGAVDSADVYRLLVGSVLPRPIAFVSTVDAAGRPNLAPYSFFTVASVDPPILAFAPQMQAGPQGGDRSKDTLANIRETGECVVHVVGHAIREAMNLTSGAWERGESEFARSGLTPVASSRVRPPRVAEAQVAWECALDQMLSWGDHPRAGTLVLVRPLLVHIADHLYADGKIDLGKLDPIGRLGGPSYVRVREAVFEMQRPTPADLEATRRRLDGR